ncbi:hypothetical protein [Luteimonas panaciterrae]|nr:hypothetical protein [Luteimonas panaciterrae]
MAKINIYSTDNTMAPTLTVFRDLGFDMPQVAGSARVSGRLGGLAF